MHRHSRQNSRRHAVQSSIPLQSKQLDDPTLTKNESRQTPAVLQQQLQGICYAHAGLIMPSSHSTAQTALSAI
jgi:hypothetical protein